MPYLNVKCDESTFYNLISEVRKRECIWNTEYDKYNERSYTAPAWLEIAKKLQLPVNFLRLKWKYLRDTHRREIKKLSPDVGYTGKWQYFQAMSFLDPATDNNDLDNNSENLETFFVQYADEDDCLSQEAYNTDPLPHARKRKKDEDYDVMFLESLMPFFRELEPMRKLVFRSKVQELLISELSRNSSSGQRRSCNEV